MKFYTYFIAWLQTQFVFYIRKREKAVAIKILKNIALPRIIFTDKNISQFIYINKSFNLCQVYTFMSKESIEFSVRMPKL